MKRLLLILILTFSFQTLAKADDISEFEIEGMSVGDSLLNYFSEKKILESKQKNQFPKSDKFIISTFYNEDFFKVYESVSFSYENNKKYIIHNIEGRIFFEKDIEECLKNKKEISAEIKNSLENVEKFEGNHNHRYDTSGKSKYIYTFFEFKSKDSIQVSCTDWSIEIENKGFVDELKVSIATNKFAIFLNNEAY